jgi:N-acetylglutamate synthase-like GNAT family acetyltransferase
LEPAPAGVLRATPSDLSYVVHLQKQHHHALGFIPRVALQEKIDLGRIWLATENGEPAGFLHHGSLAGEEVRIFQAAVQYDARRRHLGLALVRHLLRRAAAAGARGVSLRCLSSLEANDFWRVAGFSLLTTEAGARGTLNVWTQRLFVSPRDVQVPNSFAFSSRLHRCPLCGEMTMDTWTRGAIRRRLCPGCLASRRET